MLRDRAWKLKYTPDDGNLIESFYVPALEDAERYDRLTGYFNAGALALAARGVEGLVRNGGRMRLIAGCVLAPEEIAAIQRGEELRARLEQRLAEAPLAPPDEATTDALELLAWMVARGHLDVKVAVPCDIDGNPVHDAALFHEKTGIVEDRAGNRLAWTGSLNETAAGWLYNWESISVYTGWGPEPERVDGEDENFARLWADGARRAIVLDLPEAARRDLLRFMPADAPPSRLRKPKGPPPNRTEGVADPPDPPPAPPAPPPLSDLCKLVWSFIAEAPRSGPGGARVGEATAAVTPWPHQTRAFERLYGRRPPKLLIADEVGLGKTVQAGMLLRQAWLAGRAERILILAPKAVLGQWQTELREKFNLNWPVYDGRKLVRYPSPALRGMHERDAGPRGWLDEPAVIASSHLMRRRERAEVLLTEAEPWDLIVLDEAHHARRRAAGSGQEGGPNALLALMRGLKERTSGLVLLTATPMQVHPVELWDLLDLLGLPPEWTAEAFLRFFEDIEQPHPPPAALDRMARLFQAVERVWGEVGGEAARDLAGLSRLKTRKVLRALRDEAGIPRRQLEADERRAALALVRAHTPIRHLVSRHTREVLRRYFRAGMLSTPVAERRVDDRFIPMTAAERAVYDDVEDYISTVYDRADAGERAAVGFVMTVYRRRLASSFRALRATLERRLATIDAGDAARPAGLDEDAPDDETADEILDADEVGELERRAAAAEERAGIENLLGRVGRLPADSKLGRLEETLAGLRRDGYAQAMVFTQYADTMEFLRDALRAGGEARLMCFSGRGGEIPVAGGGWRAIGRGDARRRFRSGEADVLLCTDAAAEGLNFQFCGALVNYDMPWNPMRVEQRIGRIDRLGQRHATIRVFNLHYEDTVETDVYRALRDRIGLFETVVGPLQPILAQLPRTLADAVLAGGESASAVETIERRIESAGSGGFDIDALLGDGPAPAAGAPSPVTMDDLDRVIVAPDLMPPGVDVRPLGRREYGLLAPGAAERLRVTTDPAYFEESAESVELWSPGNPSFRPPATVAPAPAPFSGKTLKDILDG